jgi:hypothetical protein
MNITDFVSNACQHQDVIVGIITLASSVTGITVANMLCWSDRLKAGLPAPLLHVLNFVALHWDDILDAYRLAHACKMCGNPKCSTPVR